MRGDLVSRPIGEEMRERRPWSAQACGNCWWCRGYSAYGVDVKYVPASGTAAR